MKAKRLGITILVLVGLITSSFVLMEMKNGFDTKSADASSLNLIDWGPSKPIATSTYSERSPSIYYDGVYSYIAYSKDNDASGGNADGHDCDIYVVRSSNHFSTKSTYLVHDSPATDNCPALGYYPLGQELWCGWSDLVARDSWMKVSYDSGSSWKYSQDISGSSHNGLVSFASNSNYGSYVFEQYACVDSHLPIPGGDFYIKYRIFHSGSWSGENNVMSWTMWTHGHSLDSTAAVVDNSGKIWSFSIFKDNYPTIMCRRGYIYTLPVSWNPWPPEEIKWGNGINCISATYDKETDEIYLFYVQNGNIYYTIHELSGWSSIYNTGISITGCSWISVAIDGTGSNKHINLAYEKDFGSGNFDIYYVRGLIYQPDTEAPNVAITYPADGAKVTSSSVTVHGTASDNVAVDYVEVKVNEGVWQKATDTSSWSKTVTLSLGYNTIYARAIDTSDNTDTDQITVTYSPGDDVDPNVAITYPANGATVTSSSIMVYGSASDNVAVDHVDVKVNSGSWVRATGTTSWSKTVTLNLGSNTIYARATDTSSNTNTDQITVTCTLPPEMPWSMFHHDVTHTGRSPYDTSQTYGGLKWKYTTGSWVYSSPAIGSDNTRPLA